MTSSNPITNLANAIKGLISKHEEDKNHAEAGGTPKPIGKNLAAGTNNDYARADHVHTVEFDDVLNTPNALDVVDNLTTNDGSKPLSAKQGKWLNDNKAQLSHNHDDRYYTESEIDTKLTAKNVTVTKLNTATTGYIATYEVKQGTTSLGKIDIPKDYLVKSGSVKTVTTANSPVSGYAVGNKYIDFVINTKDSSGTDEHIYINVKDLVDTYTPESTATNIKMNGTQSAGDSSTYARGNHVHPTDTSRAPTSHASTTTTYGVATTANYGHTKVVQNLTTDDGNGLALGAGQGKILYDLKAEAECVWSTHASGTNNWEGTCTKLKRIEKGTVIYFSLRQAPTTDNAVLQLKLADGTYFPSSTTYSKIYFAGGYLKNQFPQYSLIGLVYDGANWTTISNYTNTNTTYSVATQSANGLMSSGDKTKLDGVATGANNYSHPSGTAKTGNPTANQTPAFGGSFTVTQFTSNATGHISGATDRTITLPSLGTTATTACAGNDSRLSNSRTPTFNQITANADSIKDLNTYRTGGFYYNGNNAESKYIIHCPNSNGTNTPYNDNKAFFLLIETWGASNNNYVKQTLTYYDTNKTYTRTKTGNSDANSSWTAWTEISKDTNTTYSVATQSANGLMSSGDKTKLDGVATGANNYSHPSTHAATMITDANAHTNIGSSANANQGAINTAIDTALSNKQAKGSYAAASHSHSYLPLTGGTLTGNVIFSDANNSTNNTAAGNIPWAGTPTYDTNIWTTFKAKKSGFYTFTDGSKWWNLISVRHRNGSGDATNYGAYIKTSLQDDGSLIWAKQKGGNSFMAERTILDSSNYSTYANKTSISAVSGIATTDNDKIGSVTIDGTEYSWYTPKLNNSINSTSTTQAATANAVKTAYDKGNHSHPSIANNLTTSTTGSVLDATQGKWLKDNTVQTAGTGMTKSGNTLGVKNFALAFAAQTGQGVTVKTYTDGLSVYVTFEGTASVTAGSSSSTSTTTIVTLSNTAYAPIINMQVPARESAGGHRMKLNSSGVMQFLNDTSGKSFSIHGAFYYPLKSRLP